MSARPASALLELVDRSRLVKAGYFPQEWLGAFFRNHFKLLVGLLDPECEVVETPMQSAPAALSQLETEFQALLGMYEVPRRLTRVEFIPYPGLCSRLSIVELPGSDRLTWSDVAHRKNKHRDVLLVTAAGDPGDALVRGVFLYSPTQRNIHTVDRYDADLLWQKLVDVQGRYESSCSAIITDEYMARRIQMLLPDGSVLVSEANESAPLFRLGLGVPRSDPEWRELVERTQTLMFMNAPDQFVRLYVDLVEGLGFRSLKDLGGLQVIDRSLVGDFPHRETFVRLLIRRVGAIIKNRLEHELVRLNDSTYASTVPGRLDSKELREALDRAHPHAGLDRIAEAIAEAWLNPITQG